LYSLFIGQNGSLAKPDEEDLQHQILSHKRILDLTLDKANYNLLDPNVLRVSKELDAILLRSLFEATAI
jgi:hypothetical protein